MAHNISRKLGEFDSFKFESRVMKSYNGYSNLSQAPVIFEVDSLMKLLGFGGEFWRVFSSFRHSSAVIVHSRFNKDSKRRCYLT